MDELRIEPHAAFFGRCQTSPMPQMKQKLRNLFFDVTKEVRIIILQWLNLTHPITDFLWINDDRKGLIVGAKHELGKELHFRPVFTFRLHFVSTCSTQILQSLGILTATEQHLIDKDEKLASPVCIKLASEILVGIEGYVVLKHHFEKVEECSLASIPFRGNQ